MLSKFVEHFKNFRLFYTIFTALLATTLFRSKKYSIELRLKKKFGHSTMTCVAFNAEILSLPNQHNIIMQTKPSALISIQVPSSVVKLLLALISCGIIIEQISCTKSLQQSLSTLAKESQLSLFLKCINLKFEQ